MPGFPQFDSRLTNDDIVAITGLVSSDDRVLHKEILSAMIRVNGNVEVRTGRYFGPTAAHGNVITVERSGDTWRIASVGSFVA